MRFTGSSRPSAPRRGFTVLELLLAVSIMTVIVLGLYTVFDQTQKALRGSLSQVDVLENIRATSDIMSRDLESAIPVDIRENEGPSLAITVNPVTVPVEMEGLGGASDPLFQTVLQSFYMVSRQNDIWTAIGYWVGPVSTNMQPGQLITLGRLYRFQYRTNNAAFANTNLFQRFQNQVPPWPDSQPVMDGIVHLRLTAYDGAGLPLLHNNSSLLAGNPERLSLIAALRNRYPATGNSLAWSVDNNRNTETAYHFRSTNSPPFPSSLELEIGVVEPQVVSRFNSIPVAAEARKFLARNSGQVHLFRLRIPLRNGPPY